MKQIGLIVFMLVIPFLSAHSQHFEGGVLGGLNASQVDGDTYQGYNKPGIVAGTYVLANLTRTVYAGMELKFEQKGSRKNPDLKSDDQYKYIMRLNYATLPVYLGFRTNDRISVLAGLSSGFLLSGIEYNNYGKFVKEDQHPFNDFDLQGFLGFRFQLTSRLAFDLRGAYSLLPVRDNPGEVLLYWKDSQFNNLLSTTVVYRLDF